MSQNNIPKIIHQIAPADEGKWHPFWKKCQQSWKNNFSDYKYVLWNDKEDIDTFVKKNYPRFWNLYNAFPVQIMKIDFVRMCFLHKYGGIYADMDVFCYKNFDTYLTKDIYFLENLTEEYTSAKYENSMMASIPNHQFLNELMKYTQACFIYYRNQFVKEGNNWRTPSNDAIINNTTGSGMISEAVKSLNQFFDIGVFKCSLFNNRPSSYSENFITKHIHTSIWGNEYVESDLDRLLIINGCCYSTGELCLDILKHLKDNNTPFEIVMNNDFNFNKDYSHGVYLREDNLDEIKEIVRMKH